jgi:GT2 family glycosyltransferase
LRAIVDGPVRRSVAICICTRDRPTELAATLDSIGRSNYPVRRVVVSDDGLDRQAEGVCAQATCASLVRYVQGPGRGLGANRNHALEFTDEEDLVLFLDDDCLLGPEFLSTAVACLTRQQPTASGSVIVSCTEHNRGSDITARAQTFLGFQARPYRDGEPLSSIVINATLFPRSLFDELAFDPQIRYGYDEVDLASRAVRLGYAIICCPDAVNEHRPSEFSRGDHDEFVVASRLYVTFKRYAFTDRRRRMALAFAMIAPAHAIAAGVRERGAAGGREAVGAVVLAVRYMRAHITPT